MVTQLALPGPILKGKYELFKFMISGRATILLAHSAISGYM